jgi:HPt (histidine-containing phosphotransfer) domain-containing protein
VAEGRRPDNDVHVLDADAVRALRELLGDDADALAEIVGALVDDAPQRLAELRLAAGSGDAELLGRAAHTLKSNGRTVGATAFADVCAELEALARVGLPGGAGALVEQAELEWKRVHGELLAVRDGGRVGG